MPIRNKNLSKLKSGYLFPEISRRKKEYLRKNPDARIISLGIGDTTLPIIPSIIDEFVAKCREMGTSEGYTGYGDECGIEQLRDSISKRLYNGIVSADEIFISDGAKPEIGRLQMMFGDENKFAVQDPSYPVYVDSAVIAGQTGLLNENSGTFHGITYLPCSPANDFCPDLSLIPENSVIFFCSPNNPTGAVTTKEQLKSLVKHAATKKAIIIFDAAYSQYITGGDLPRSIFEIPGARDVAIEINSFSKMAGFTGIRLGWTVVPKELSYDNGESVYKDFSRINSTVFNGASIIAQHGGLAVLTDRGMQALSEQVDYYMNNARLIKTALDGLGYTTYGGENAPYIWTKVSGLSSWDAFAMFLEKTHIVCTPGAGFGPAGEGFIRFSAFGQRSDIEEAVRRLKVVTA